MNNDALKLLRKSIRQQRRALTIFQQRQAEQAILAYAHHHAKFKSAQHIGLYLHDFGEIFTQKLMEYCFSQQKNMYLPQICEMNQHLVWVKISRHQYRNQRFVRHRLKMLEAKASRGRAIQHLDIVFMPLLACDSVGMRLGMGGGFYDRTLANVPYRPYRIGLAHDFQYLRQLLPAQKWDEGVDELWIPSALYRFKR